MAAFVFKNLEDIEKVTDALAGMLNNNLALFKFGLIIWLHKDISRIINNLQSILATECESEIPAEIINQENQREQRISGFYSSCFVLAGILSALKPIMRVGFIFLSTGEVFLEMNIPSAYPWDNQKPYNYLLSWSLLSAASFVALFKTAQHKIQLIVGKTPQETQDRLHSTLHLYKVGLEISEALKYYFRLLICIQLVMASIHLCVLSYTLSISFGQSQMLFYIVFGIAILVQLYLYCQCGEYLKTESSEFARAIYDSPWYEATVINPSVGRSLQIAMMRAQRGSHIDGYFFEANMEVFLSIVMTAGSYFTLLQSLS
ncbi:odorant receptor 47a-like [Drosophila innubila]|uniref:odorant receptor 47a-like n=1 Tax=Drosophila innubila TaxID=198719 RepID=UPI00148B5055|nr:odorant receptor 47a-like [Drosophila innubila]